MGSVAFDFSGETVVITGAAAGIGHAAARLFLDSGAELVLGDLDGDRLAAMQAELDPAGTRIATAAYDAARPGDAALLAGLARDRFGKVDRLVPCAGIYRSAPFASMTDEQWSTTLAVNVDGVFRLVRACLPLMPDGASIVTIASVAAHEGASPNYAHYGASKGAILGLTRSLAKELGPRIRVNAVAPGSIATPMIADRIATLGDQILARTPLKRFGEAAEIARIIAFLSSDAAAFMTGESVLATGGFHIG